MVMGQGYHILVSVLLIQSMLRVSPAQLATRRVQAERCRPEL